MRLGLGLHKRSLRKSGKNPNFIIRVKTDNAGTSNNDQVTLPLTGTYPIDWGDGTTETLTTVAGVSDPTHTYASAGEYDIKIGVGLTRILFNNVGDKDKLIEIKNWGDIAWSSMDGAFFGCTNLIISATDIPNLSNISSLFLTFRNCGSLVEIPIIENWDVSNITDFTLTFQANNETQQKDLLNPNVENWNVSNTEIFNGTFSGLLNFDRNLANWDITNVTNFNNFLLGTTGLSTPNYNATLIGWEATLQASFPNGVGYTPSISIDFGGSQYSSADAIIARDSLINNFGWTITDGGFDEASATLGAELVTNGTFDTDTDWDKEGLWTISGGEATMPATTSYLPLHQNIGLVDTKYYYLSYNLVSVSGSFSSRAIVSTNINNNTTIEGAITNTGLKSNVFSPTSSQDSIAFSRQTSGVSTSATIDNVSVKEIL